jgi:hypothetical protein
MKIRQWISSDSNSEYAFESVRGAFANDEGSYSEYSNFMY